MDGGFLLLAAAVLSCQSSQYLCRDVVDPGSAPFDVALETSRHFTFAHRFGRGGPEKKTERRQMIRGRRRSGPIDSFGRSGTGGRKHGVRLIVRRREIILGNRRAR